MKQTPDDLRLNGHSSEMTQDFVGDSEEVVDCSFKVEKYLVKGNTKKRKDLRKMWK